MYIVIRGSCISTSEFIYRSFNTKLALDESEEVAGT